MEQTKKPIGRYISSEILRFEVSGASFLSISPQQQQPVEFAAMLYLALALAFLGKVVVALQSYGTSGYLSYYVRYSPDTGYLHVPVPRLVDGTATIARPAGE